MNPYLIQGPALISFSGGRTSAYMLHEILSAHGGQLPGDVHVTFANTGKEREETLRFVHDCATHWNVRVRWLERASDGGFTEVGYNSASRKGEPFAALIAKKQYLPNAVTRFCTVELKIRVMRDFGRSVGFEASPRTVSGTAQAVYLPITFTRLATAMPPKWPPSRAAPSTDTGRSHDLLSQ